MNSSNLNKLVKTALFAALCCVVTMAIPIPTITGGYINIGDTFVILSGIFLGPIYGGLAAGIGSMFSDIFLGYISYAPATLIIKFLAASAVGMTYHKLNSISIFHNKSQKNSTSITGTSNPLQNSNNQFTGLQFLLPILSGLISSCIVILGYFLYEWLLTDNMFAAAFSGISGNLIQGLTSTILATLIYPILMKIPTQY